MTIKYDTVFALVSDALRKTGARAILVGGFAVNCYNYSRQTADVDFLITEADFAKIFPLLEKEGYKKERAIDLFTRLRCDKEGFIDLDFLFTDKNTIENMRKDGKEADIAGKRFIVPSLNNLIAMKLHSLKNSFESRKNDLLDILILVRANKVDAKSSDFKELCMKYGTEEIYKKITENL